MAQDLYEQPGTVAARTGFEFESLLASLHTGIKTDQVGNFLLHQLINCNQKIDDRLLAAIHAFEQLQQVCAAISDEQIRRKILSGLFIVLEWKKFIAFVEKKIKRIDDCHVGNHFDIDHEVACAFRKNNSCEVVCEGVLLPVDEVFCGRYF